MSVSHAAYFLILDRPTLSPGGNHGHSVTSLLAVYSCTPCCNQTKILEVVLLVPNYIVLDLVIKGMKRKKMPVKLSYMDLICPV